MSPKERDDLELGAHAIWAFLYGENHGTEDDRAVVIRNRFPEARTKTGPSHKRPKALRLVTALAGLLVLATAGCTYPFDVQIGDPLGPIRATNVVTATCTNGPFTFTYYGSEETVPPECTIVDPSRTPLLQERGAK